MENSQGSTNPAEGESLEGPSEGQQPENTASSQKTPETPKKKKGGGFFSKFSIYLMLFLLVIILAVMVVVISYLHSHSQPAKKISNQNLSQSALSQLSSSDVTVGDAKQVLNVQSNAVFAGQVLVRSDLSVAGKLQVGGTLTISNLNVSGTIIGDTLQVNKNLQVAGDSAFQGQLTVQKNLSVSGSGTFTGAISAPQVTANSLQLNGDLNLTHHITAGGANPGRTNGNALGGGGTASVSGSDTAGSITINTGSAPSIGCLVSVTFANKFNTTPHVVVTPIEAAAGGLGYYVTRSTTGFSVCTTTAPGGGQSFGFDYIVFD